MLIANEPFLQSSVECFILFSCVPVIIPVICYLLLLHEVHIGTIAGMRRFPFTFTKICAPKVALLGHGALIHFPELSWVTFVGSYRIRKAEIEVFFPASFFFSPNNMQNNLFYQLSGRQGDREGGTTFLFKFILK